MSIVASALRIAATRALLAAGTVAGARVFDSVIIPIDDLVTADPKPFVIVSTEDDNSEPGGRDINNGSRELQFAIEHAIGRAIALDNGAGETIVVPQTDAGLEVSLAILSRQIEACLFGRGGGVWGDIFRRLTSGINSISSRRGVQTKEGTRMAARATVYVIRALAEPPFGAQLDPSSPLAAFFAAAAADEELAPIASLMRNAVEGIPADWPAVFDAASVLGGYTDEEGQALGIAPLAMPDEGDDQALATEATISPDLWLIDEKEIAAQLPGETSP